MKIKSFLKFFLLILVTMTGVACSGWVGVRSGGYAYHYPDFHYRNPWNDFDRFRRPIIIAPPPVIEPPIDNIDPDFGVDPGPMLEPMLMN